MFRCTPAATDGQLPNAFSVRCSFFKHPLASFSRAPVPLLMYFLTLFPACPRSKSQID
ncbi:hypothetical protein T4C_9621 [Trichinella pseudospiralis]|uniref:Uncharacterized protein n=1 Tax=Trichinella pseudospiralis TaxID=6337 RepID=A0A0V1GHR9_TRIPS|nr:hypothetical protein T4C_9621 [Trichinella pseudospiralis]